MKVQFIGFNNTGWLEQRRYRKLMFRWLEEHIKILDEVTQDRVLNELNKFTVRVFPSTQYKYIYGNARDFISDKETSLSDRIPHEVMGQYKLDVFMLDDKGDMQFASNLIMLSHGLGHCLLYSYDRKRRIELKQRDASGNPKGMILNWFTAAVHNRTEKMDKTVQRLNDPDIENEIMYLTTYRFKNGFWRKTYYRTYDFRDDF